MLALIYKDESGTAFLEMALMAFMMIVLTFSSVEFGYAWWQWNGAEKATQLAARLAVASDPLATELATFTCGTGSLLPGAPCSTPGAVSFGTITCSGASNSCSGGYTFNNTEFTRLVTRMQSIYPDVTPANIVVEYRDVGLGFVGRPRPVPLVSVRLVDMTFNFIALSGLIPGPITMPEFRATLPGEDITTAGVS
jgi:hypothetical protein